jgi:Glycosyltransferase family 87
MSGARHDEQGPVRSNTSPRRKRNSGIVIGTASTASAAATMAIPLVGLALVSTWFVASYGAVAPTQMLSFPVGDGWCATATESIGGHCFGDYALVHALFATGDPWNSAMRGIASWPALAWMPAIVVSHLGRLTGVGWAGAAIFAVLSAVALLTPAWWAARRGTAVSRVTLLTIAGAATTPFVVTVDRGNPIAFTVPLLLWAGVSFARRRWTPMVVAIVAASLLRPQMALLLVLVLVHRQWWRAVIGAASSVVATVLGFLAFPSHFPANVIGWVHSILGRTGDYQPLNQVYPYNIGVGRSLLTVADGTGLTAWMGAEGRSRLVELLTRAGPVLLVLALGVGTLALWFGRRSMAPASAFGLATMVSLYTSSTVYLYYVAALLVVVALVHRDAGAAAESTASTVDRRARRPGTPLVTATAVTFVMAPVILPVPAHWFGDSLVTWVSLWQVLVGPALLIWFCWLAVAGLRSARSGSLVEDPSSPAPPAATEPAAS